jgi:hypothetical protein
MATTETETWDCFIRDLASTGADGYLNAEIYPSFVRYLREQTNYELRFPITDDKVQILIDSRWSTVTAL